MAWSRAADAFFDHLIEKIANHTKNASSLRN
jgi:hypothetical protein